MKSYEQFCPVARAAEIVAERWTPLILRNLLAGCQTFTEILEGAPGMPRSVLSQRLRYLEGREIVERRPAADGKGHTYALTPIGVELTPVVEALGVWGARWLDLDEQHLDPYLVLWDMSRLIPPPDLPSRPVAIRFRFTDLDTRNRLWLLLQPTRAEVCDKNPGVDDELRVTTDTVTLIHWHLGWLPLEDAAKAGRILIEGPAPLKGTFARQWQGLSRFAGVPRGRPALSTAAAP